MMDSERVPLPPSFHAALDAGLDPLDGAEAWLLDHPEALETFARVRAELRGIAARPVVGGSASSRPRRVIGRRAAGLVAATILTAASFVAILLWPAPAVPESGPVPLPRPSLAPASLVRHCTTRERAADDRASFVAVNETGFVAARRRAEVVTRASPSVSVLTCTTTIALEKTHRP